MSNEIPGDLDDGIDCPICKNRGFIWFVDKSGCENTRNCRCRVQRDTIKRMKNSGLGDLLERYTFDTWQTPGPWYASALDTARDYAEKKAGWFLAMGGSGNGKTHLCTAICGELMRAGLPVQYVLWRDMSVRAKAVANDAAEYCRIVEPLKQVGVLYIDDLFKTMDGAKVTSGDVNLAFDILNWRYNDTEKLTIISTEKTLQQLLAIDEATASRIYERSEGHRLNFKDIKNQRLMQLMQKGFDK